MFPWDLIPIMESRCLDDMTSQEIIFLADYIKCQVDTSVEVHLGTYIPE